MTHYRNAPDGISDDETARQIESAFVEANGGDPLPTPKQIKQLAAIEREQWSRLEERRRVVQPNPRPQLIERSVVVGRRHAERRSD